MASSLFAALSGLQSHQSWIDLIGNNLGKVNGWVAADAIRGRVTAVADEPT